MATLILEGIFFLVSGKVALLIGNQGYQYADSLGHLFHPINDVFDLSASLIDLGFKVIICRLNSMYFLESL